MESNNLDPCETPFGNFTRIENTITYYEEFAPDIPGYKKSCCDIHITVIIEPVISIVNPQQIERWVFNITYTNIFNGDKRRSAMCHPLHEIVAASGDESLMEGSYVSANPITFHMIECLMSDEIYDDHNYDTGIVTTNCYKGQIIRALTEMEV